MDIAQYCSQIPRNIVHNGYCAILSTNIAQYCPLQGLFSVFLDCTTKSSPHLIVMTLIIKSRAPQIMYIIMTVYGHLHRLQRTKTIFMLTQRFKCMNPVKTDAHLNCRLYKNVLGTSQKTHSLCSGTSSVY